MLSSRKASKSFVVSIDKSLNQLNYFFWIKDKNSASSTEVESGQLLQRLHHHEQVVKHYDLQAD
jgi:hypothetical protein